MAVQPKLAQLKSQLAITGLQKKDNALFQVISQLIDFVSQSQQATGEEIISTGGSITDLSGKDFLTHTDQSTSLPNSRRLLAGTDISFDDTVANQRTINSIASGSDWDVLTNGNIINPELIFAGGEVIMLEF